MAAQGAKAAEPVGKVPPGSDTASRGSGGAGGCSQLTFGCRLKSPKWLLAGREQHILLPWHQDTT